MRFTQTDAAVAEIIQQTNGNIVLGLPLGLGKPNRLVNSLFQAVASQPSVKLSILTALSLTRPALGKGFQHRFLEEFVERVYADYEELDYLKAARSGSLPDNIEVHEFFVQPASELGNAYTQQNYVNSNYTHVARDMARRGVNVIAQAVARRESADGECFSLSCNPEVTLDAIPSIHERRAAGETVLIVGQVHPDMPFMENDAEVAADFFDIVVDDPTYCTRLISTPSMPVSMTEHFIGLGASALVRDGGTLQIGIGALGDAVASSLLLRESDNASYRQLLADAGLSEQAFPVLEEGGDPGRFTQGLYGCSEMFIYGLFQLIKAGVIKRKVIDGEGRAIHMHGGFFLGPAAFYQALRELTPEQQSLINMTRISFVNGLYGDEELKREHRKDARFINTAFSVTLMGAGIADQLEDGRMLSGVGGQYNFVAQAHELEGARSVLLVRATREKDGETRSNILWNYGHTTIPRHLRDIVVTEYGVADLRSKSDSEVIQAMLSVSDSRFQEELKKRAIEEGKLPADYEIPSNYRNNTPQRLIEIYRRHHAEGRMVEFPLGSDFTYIEETLIAALAWLKANVKPGAMAELARKSFMSDAVGAHFQPHLARMGLAEPDSIREKLQRTLLLIALSEVTHYSESL